MTCPKLELDLNVEVEKNLLFAMCSVGIKTSYLSLLSIDAAIRRGRRFVEQCCTTDINIV